MFGGKVFINSHIKFSYSLKLKIFIQSFKNIMKELK
jgi:hypothetical protein